MAYSGAIAMCSGRFHYPNLSSPASFLTLGLSGLVLAGLLLNRKGRKTRVAIGLALVGMLLMATGQLLRPSALLYYGGVVLLFFGIWYNGSFGYFYRKVAHSIKKSLTNLRYDRGKL